MTNLKLLYYRLGAWCCRVGLFLMALMILTGCKTVKTSKETTTATTDTIYKDRLVVKRDTTFLTESAKVVVQMPVSRTDTLFSKPIKRQFKNAKLDIHKKGDTVFIECECDTLAIKAQLQDVYEKEYRARSKIEQINTLEKQELTTLQKFMVSCGYLFWILALIGTIYFITKRK